MFTQTKMYPSNHRSKILPWRKTAFLLLVSFLLAACAGPGPESQPLPTDWLATSIAATMGASQASPAISPEPFIPTGESQVIAPAESISHPETPSPSAATPSPDLPQVAAVSVTSPTATIKPAFEAPRAPIQIHRPGDQSKVTSPLRVVAYLKPGEAGKVKVELFGEDGRLLVRQLLTYTTEPNAYANLTADLDFEITAAAEVGRLVITVEDQAGRFLSLNSVDLILLSVGEADINPATALDEAIMIEQPRVKSLVQGSSLLVSGKALLHTQDALVVQLVNARQGVVGMRLASVSTPAGGGFGDFAVEVPFTVSAATPVRLVVFERGGAISEMVYLTSREILLSP